MNSTLAPEKPMEEVCVESLLDKARGGDAEPMGQLLQLYRNYLTILATIQLDQRLRRANESVGPRSGNDAGRSPRLHEFSRRF